ncbi:MAG: hypothetical protein D3910_25825, partial [Candidatus Electrothrix sp. ATG2]|nr:hypothetical protein [Candidatus Electrothrix sp. ATG2]
MCLPFFISIPTHPTKKILSFSSRNLARQAGIFFLWQSSLQDFYSTLEGYLMFLSVFFKGSWLVQLIVGIGLFACSFFLEYRVLRSFFSPQPLALLLAVTLECGKISAIIWHYYLHHLSEHE